MTIEERKNALKYLRFLKEKRCGKIKARDCADGRKQCLYKTKEETSSPMISIKSLFLTYVIDAMENRCMATCNIPGAFMHADMDEVVHVKLEGEIAKLLLKVDSSYNRYLIYKHNRPVIHTELNKALYGTLQAALLFWTNLKKFFIDKHGFTENPYDGCVVNKEIHGKQCTIGWHVDDIKISHIYNDIVESIIELLEREYGQESPLTITRGPVHDYLGMTIDYCDKGKVKFTMLDYIDQLINKMPLELTSGSSATPAGNHLFNVDPKAKSLPAEKAELFHHLTAKLLYLCKRTRPDLQTAVAFLTTRVQNPNEDDWKKLGRCLCYLHVTRLLPLILEATHPLLLHWWVDASYAVHHDMRSHTGATFTLGKGSVYSLSTKQKINTRSSTEAELVGMNDAMALILWTRHFLEGQGFTVTDNVVFQDNESMMLLENNGRLSSTKRTRHIEIRYFFVTDNIKRGRLQVMHCPTKLMVADFFTKPLQGAQFRLFRDQMRNCVITLVGPAAQECVGATTGVDAHNGLPSGPPPGSTPQMDGVNDVAHTSDVAQVHLGRQHHASQPRGTGSGICPTFTYRLPVVAC